MGSERPPRLVSWLFAALLPPRARAEMLGDFFERFAEIAESDGRGSAKRWAWRQLLSLRPIALRREASSAQRSGRATGPREGGALMDSWIGEWLGGFRHGLRAVRTRPGASMTVIATVALAIGATTAVFSVVRGVLLNPLPYPESDRLVQIFQTKSGWLDSPNSQLRAFANRFPIAVPTFNDWAREDTGFESIGAFSDQSFVLQGVDGAEIVSGQIATSGVFGALGVPAQLGRTLIPDDDVPGAPRVVVLGHGLWQGRLGARNDVLGESLALDGVTHTIVGVMPASFRAPEADAQLWTPLSDDQKADGRGTQYLTVIGRLAGDTPLELAAERMAAIEARLALEYPDSQGDLGARLESLLDSLVGDVRSTIWFLFGAVGLVLLIASVNIANMLAVMGLSRKRELAVKAALGAGARRLVGGLLAETCVLAGLGGLAGVLLAGASMPLLLRIVPPSVPRSDEIGMDVAVILFGLGVTAVTALLVGILPAMQAARTQPQDVIKTASRGTAGDRGGNRLRTGLVVTEVALAFVLLVCAGLLGSSFMRLSGDDRGFTSEGLIVMTVYPDPEAYPERDDRDRFRSLLREKLEAIPGTAVSAANQVPLTGSMSTTSYQTERPEGEPEDTHFIISVVLEDYLDVMSIPVTEGRSFSASDVREAPLVGIVNQSAAQELWSGESPIGKRVRSGGEAEWTTVVGVAGNVRHQGLGVEPEPKLYVPALQNHRYPGHWVLRARGDLAGATQLARRAVSELSASTPVRETRVLEESIALSVAVPRFRAYLLLGLAGMAAALALLGVYGVITFAVAQRTKEIGVRMALGARPQSVTRAVVASGLRLAAGGVALGLAVTIPLSRLMGDFLYQIEATDPRVYAAIAVGVGLVSAAAAYVPAKRAASVDPIAVLNSD